MHLSSALSVRRAVLALLVVGVAACGTGDDVSGQSSSEWKTDFSKTTVDMAEIMSGGPPKDGIPAIDEPRFISVRDADRFLEDDEAVAVVRVGGETKVYPIQILMWHEIANDEIGGVPVSVTYCPLCNTTLAFDRRFDGKILDFGTTGNLRHSDLVMYDRQTETWWQQATGEGIVGHYAGEQLTFIPSPVMRWEDVREQMPSATVLSRETEHEGYARRYGTNPYQGYDRREGPIRQLFRGPTNDELPPMERVVALQGTDESWAVPFSVLRDEGLAQLDFEERPVVVFFQPATASSVDDGRIAGGRAVGSSAVYSATVDGRVLHFETTDRPATYRDRETGSRWNVSGQATDGPLEGQQLDEVPHGNHFWFAWAVFRPDTRIWRP